jgi:hypothetical protein
MNPKLFEAINEIKTIKLGEYGLPEHYPTPPCNENLLFYIQRNHNMNTVVYEINKLHDGRVNEEYPMHVFWLRYSDNGEIQELNYIQNKLAYGYTSKKITNTTFEFELVSYNKLKFYIDQCDSGQFNVFTKINDKMSKIENIYVYVEDFGLFPDVKYIELYGMQISNNAYNYEKIYI